MSIIKDNLSLIFFVIGLFPLAYLNEMLKAHSTDQWLRLIVVVLYVLLLRLISDFLSKKLRS